MPPSSRQGHVARDARVSVLASARLGPLVLAGTTTGRGVQMSGRFAREDEVAAWHEDGWVLLDALIPTDEIDAAVVDLSETFPTAEEYHADPAAAVEKWLGQRPAPRESFVWPPTGPGFRPEQHHWAGLFPFPGTGAL